jgi:hypothetical protein
VTAYSPTTWVNNTPPPLSAANLNKLTDELESQAAAKGIAHTLPAWADGVAPALTDAAPLNEMERVLQAVASSLSLSYTPTVWSAGWVPTRNSTRLNRMEVQAQANRAAIDQVVPPTGTLRGHFTDFYCQWGYSSSDHNGQIFQNRWNLGSGWGLQTLSDPQTPWPSIGGPAITEVNDSAGRPGFRFRCNPEMVASSGGKKVEIYEAGGNPYGASMVRGAPYTDEISFYVLFPASGNQNGWPMYSDFNVFWQHDTGTISGFGIDTDPAHNPPRFYCGLLRANNANPPGGRLQPSWFVQTDITYHFRFVVKWATDNTGTWQWWIQRPSDPTEIQYMNYSGITQSSNRPNTEFGFYSGATLNNEVIISDVRVTWH